MVSIKNEKEIAIMRQGRVVMGAIFDEVRRFLKPGVTPLELDEHVEDLCQEYGVKPAFKGYRGFPACVCASKNDVVVHGIPDQTPLTSGDIVGIDFGIIKDQLYLDSAYTFVMGQGSPEVLQLIEVTQRSCLAGVAAARRGNTVQDISRAVEGVIKPFGYGIVKGYVGHGIGYKLHEDPQIPNYDTGHKGIELKPGMTLAIEPMVNLGADEVYVDPDQWAVRTKDKQVSAHFEHTVLVTEGEPEVLTRWPSAV